MPAASCRKPRSEHGGKQLLGRGFTLVTYASIPSCILANTLSIEMVYALAAFAAIARMLPGRTNAAVKNFWYAHKRRSQRARR